MSNQVDPTRFRVSLTELLHTTGTIGTIRAVIRYRKRDLDDVQKTLVSIPHQGNSFSRVKLNIEKSLPSEDLVSFYILRKS